jgi:hypothetical protein
VIYSISGQGYACPEFQHSLIARGALDRKYVLALGLPLIALALGSLSMSAVPPQNQDPLIGTWNVSSPGQSPFIAVMTFNLGGTTVEYDTSGTNSSASPGETISLGKWRKTGNLTYKFGAENYIYDSSGNLSLIAVIDCGLSLAPALNSYADACALNFYQCILSQCPGPLFSGPVSVTATAVRF